MKPFSFHTAQTVKDALKLLGRYRGGAALLAGGTDLVVRMKLGRAAPEAVIDIKEIAALRGVRMSGKGRVSIGPLTTLTEIAADKLIRRKLPVLAETAEQMASPQVRNRGTIGGNIANAAPSADMAPPLIALGARVQVLTRRGTRTIPLEDFFTGPGETVLKKNCILGRITIPIPPRRARITYKPLCLREAMDLAIASAAVYIEKERGKIKVARIVLGAVAPVPLRVTVAEEALIGTKGEATAINESARIAAEAAKPITDVRGTKEYRREMVNVLVRRALKKII
jgi:carbon-monoxide dehydrogenase medium subunit